MNKYNKPSPKRTQISGDTIANILKADKILNHSLSGLKRRAKNVGQEIADLEWARICIENAVSGLKKLKSGELE